MAHEPKLTIYIITLSPAHNTHWNNNKWLFKNKIGQGNTTRIENTEIFNNIFNKFIQELDTPSMYKEDSSKKCMTIPQNNSGTNNSLRVHSSNFIIEGKIEGGSFGRKRKKTSVANKNITTQVDENDAITEDFYFLAYLPLESNKSILMVQSYSDGSIDAVIKKFWTNFMSHSGHFNHPQIHKFVPNSIINDFKNNSVVSSFTYTTEFPGQTLLEDPLVKAEQNFSISISITPNEELTIEEFNRTFNNLRKLAFSKVPLQFFSKKKGKLRDNTTKKTSPFELESNFEISPVIFLSKYIQINNTSSDFDRIKGYCFNLLEEVKSEIYPENGVQER